MSLDDEWDSGLVGKLAAGRYLIVGKLATDRRRTLYEAEDVKVGARVLLGAIRTDGSSTDQRLRDGEQLRSLEHPGLVRILDVGTLENGELYVTTDSPEGTPLRELPRGRLDQRRALLVVRQVLEALVAAHAVGTIHGDVTPDNILILPGLGDERVTLRDFGVATLTGPARDGAPAYSAPESALGAIDARADIYSIGAVLFELLTGHPPFFAEDADALRRLHAYAPVQTLGQRAPGVSFSDSLEKVVATALAKDRAERFQSAADMLAALDPALREIEQAALPPPSSEPRQGLDESLLLLANDLIAQAREQPAASEPIVPANVGRQVPALTWRTRLYLFTRPVFVRARAIAGRLVSTIRSRARAIGGRLVATIRSLGRPQKRILGAVAGVLAISLVLAIVMCGGRTAPSDVAYRAETLLEQGKSGQAIELIEREIAAHPGNARNHVVLGEALLALNHHGRALAAYEKAIGLTATIATEPAVLASLGRIADSDDTAAAIGALELVAKHGGTSGAVVIASHASTNPHADVRHRASQLAERAGSAGQIDRVTSWSLDLDQAESCDERRQLINKLGKTTDQRALPALNRAKALACVEHDAEAAIEHIGARRTP